MISRTPALSTYSTAALLRSNFRDGRLSLPILNSGLKAAASFRANLASIIEPRRMPVASSRMRDFSQSIRIMASMASFLSHIVLEKSSIATMHL